MGQEKVTALPAGIPDDRPRVGVGVVLLRNGRVLLGLRQGAHGAGLWALPGGHLEFGETPESCAAREVLEETGLRVPLAEFRHAGFTHDVFPEIGRHYITLFVEGVAPAGEPALREPHKCLRWAWFEWDAVPALPLFGPLRTLLDQGYRPRLV